MAATITAGLYIASAFTETPEAVSVVEFLAHLANYDHDCAGRHGSSLELGRSFYSIGYRYYKDRLLSRSGVENDLLEGLFRQFLVDESPASARGRSSLLRQAFESLFLTRSHVGSFDRQVVSDLLELLRRSGDDTTVSGTPAERTFHKASLLSQKLASSAVCSAIDHLRAGRVVNCLQTASSIAPLALCVAPYVAAFQTQHQDRRLLDEIGDRWTSTPEKPRRHLAWFTDTFGESNGVARTIETFGREAAVRGDTLSILTCLDRQPDAPNVLNFQPTGRFEFDEYPGQELKFPPLLEVVRECERLGVTEVVVSTPGPMGATGLAAARLLGLRVTGIYHTDFPAYVRSFTASTHLEQLTWAYMRWFFDRADVLFVPSLLYVDDLADRGFDRTRMKLMPRGVDCTRFSPSHHDPGFWERFGRKNRLRFLSVGRISREKNLDTLIESFLAIRSLGVDAELTLVGDGPYLEELSGTHRHDDVLFAGALHGDELAAAYASSDVFVFPSRTDTFGNVVLEGQASGLPAIVSDRCGAHEIVAAEGWGRVVDTAVPGPLAEAMTELARDADLRRSLAQRALETVGPRSHDRWAREFWDQIVGTGEPITHLAPVGVEPTRRPSSTDRRSR